MPELLESLLPEEEPLDPESDEDDEEDEEDESEDEAEDDEPSLPFFEDASDEPVPAAVLLDEELRLSLR